MSAEQDASLPGSQTASAQPTLTTTATLTLWIQFHENQIKLANRVKREAEISLPRLRELKAELEKEFGNGAAPVAQGAPPDAPPEPVSGKAKPKYENTAWEFIIEILSASEVLDVGEVMAAASEQGRAYSRTAVDNALSFLIDLDVAQREKPTDGRRSKYVYSLAG